MEDALAPDTIWILAPKKTLVLILVLMEDALAPLRSYFENTPQEGLNPCFNGRCTRTVMKRMPVWWLR